MSRALWLGALAGCLLTACGDRVLRAFEPEALALGGSGSSGSSGSSGGLGPDAEAGGGSGGTTVDSGAGAGAEGPSLPLLIDDFEDGDPKAKAPFGWWYPVNDEKGTQGFGIEPVTGSTASVYALRTHGSGFQEWGSAVGVDLIGQSTPRSLLSYKELCFVARVEAGSSTSIQVHLLRGAQHYTQEVSLSEAWTRSCLALTDFTTSTQEALVPNEIIALQFFFAPTAPFSFWLDDVEVVP